VRTGVPQFVTEERRLPRCRRLPCRRRSRAVEALLATRAAEGLHFQVVVALPGRTASFEVIPGATQPIDVASSVSDRKRPVLLAVALVSGLIVLVRLRRQATRT
jgi:hypothetical protein